MSNPNLTYEEYLADISHKCTDECRRFCDECDSKICLDNVDYGYAGDILFCEKCLEK